MNKLNLNSSIGKSVTENPELVSVYMDYNIDFCCGGNRSVMEAILTDYGQVDVVVKDAEEAMDKAMQIIDQSGQKKLLSDLSTADLIEQIKVKHHAYLKIDMPVISELLFKILMVHGENHSELYDVHKIFSQLRQELESHMVKEEIRLFPKLIEGTTDLKVLIEELEKEHDGAGDAIHKLTEITDHFKLPQDACKTYAITYDKLKFLVADMYMHVHTENNVLFKRFN